MRVSEAGFLRIATMRVLRPRTAPWPLALLLASVCATPLLIAQAQPSAQQSDSQQPPQQSEGGHGRGYGYGGGRGMGMAGSGAAGTVTAISGDDITVKNEQGETYKILTGPNTHFRKDRAEARISDIKVGDVVMAAGNVDDQAKTVGAVFVVVLDPQQAARMEQMRASFGKTWTMGKVTAIKDLTLTVERPDKLTQVIAVDENTLFHRRGPDGNEDITFPDIKVGDRVRATGSLQDNKFQAADLTVMTPGMMGAGRPRQNQNPPPSSAPQPPGAASAIPQN